MFRKVLLVIVASVALFASSESSFPADWKSYSSVKTPLAVIGALPDCNADVSSLPAIYQETVATYCAVKPGGPGAVEILVNSTAKSAYSKRDGNFPDGSVLILHLKDLKVLFITTYHGNKPSYSIYTEDGQDAANAPGSGLNPNDCRTCHTGYGAFCLNGQCATQK
jgi:predicted Rdx family selenoprotein